MLRELQFDTIKLNQLVEHYQQQFETDIHDAEARVHKHINRIIRIFESVDQRLATIDDFRYRLEKRVSDTVRYMDKTTPGMASRLSRVIAEISQKDGREIPRIRSLETVGFIAPGSVRSPVKRRTPAEPTVITKQEIDPKVLELRRLFKEHKDRRTVKVDRIEAYLERHLIGREQVNASDFSIETIEDYICFSYIRHLNSLGKKARKTAEKYEVQLQETYISVADMVECRDFVITRKDQAKEVSNVR